MSATAFLAIGDNSKSVLGSFSGYLGWKFLQFASVAECILPDGEGGEAVMRAGRPVG